MIKLKNKLSSPLIFFILSFLAYTVITLVIFYHRLPNITTQFAMPDVDTDGGLWYQWYIYYTNSHNLLPQITTLFVYPFGYDLTFTPFSNLIYSIQLFFLEYVLGFSWSNLVLVTNISSLITYPLSGIGGLFLCYYITKNKWSSFMAGTIFAFSFYHIYMGRGQMSINHIEFIPFYILSLVYFLDVRTLRSLLISSLLFSFTFIADPYYAFFSGIFSVLIVLFYKSESIFKKIETFIAYYSGIFVVGILTNLSFILSNLYLFDKVQLAQTGRNSIPKNELVNILYYFSKIIDTNFNFLYHYIGPFSYFLVILPMVIAVGGIIILRDNRKYLLFFVCFLLAIVLSSYIPSLYSINILYFKFFGMFRGVSRMILPAGLFLGLLVGMVIQYILHDSKKMSNKQKYLFVTGYVFLLATILITGLNTDPTWTRNTDFAKIAKLYEPIKKNNNIKVIATYPMTTGGVVAGCPQGYQLLGQIIHNKSFACGASPFSKEAINYYHNISDISKPTTIDILSKYHIDTIFISNNLLLESSNINNQLKNDSRLQYIDNYKESPDNGYISTNDLSRNISVYQIKKVVEENKSPTEIFGTEGNAKLISYKKINEYKYSLQVKVSGKGKLFFDAPYSQKWILLPGDVTGKNDLTFLGKQSPYHHTQYHDYANAWDLTSKDTNLTLYFAPRSLNYFADIIKNITILFIIILIIADKKIVYTIRRITSFGKI